MKRVSILLSLFLVHIVGYAQFKTIAAGPLFQEPEKGYAKILQLKNGNTLFFHSTKKDGIDLVIYNKQRKQIATRTLESKLWDVEKMKKTIITKWPYKRGHFRFHAVLIPE